MSAQTPASTTTLVPNTAGVAPFTTQSPFTTLADIEFASTRIVQACVWAHLQQQVRPGATVAAVDLGNTSHFLSLEGLSERLQGLICTSPGARQPAHDVFYAAVGRAVGCDAKTAARTMRDLCAALLDVAVCPPDAPGAFRDVWPSGAHRFVPLLHQPALCVRFTHISADAGASVLQIVLSWANSTDPANLKLRQIGFDSRWQPTSGLRAVQAYIRGHVELDTRGEQSPISCCCEFDQLLVELLLRRPLVFVACTPAGDLLTCAARGSAIVDASVASLNAGSLLPLAIDSSGLIASLSKDDDFLVGAGDDEDDGEVSVDSRESDDESDDESLDQVAGAGAGARDGDVERERQPRMLPSAEILADANAVKAHGAALKQVHAPRMFIRSSSERRFLYGCPCVDGVVLEYKFDNDLGAFKRTKEAAHLCDPAVGRTLSDQRAPDLLIDQELANFDLTGEITSNAVKQALAVRSVTVGVQKARRLAAKLRLRAFGSIESNFHQLPDYLVALERGGAYVDLWTHNNQLLGYFFAPGYAREYTKNSARQFVCDFTFAKRGGGMEGGMFFAAVAPQFGIQRRVPIKPRKEASAPTAIRTATVLIGFGYCDGNESNQAWTYMMRRIREAKLFVDDKDKEHAPVLVMTDGRNGVKEIVEAPPADGDPKLPFYHVRDAEHLARTLKSDLGELGNGVGWRVVLTCVVVPLMLSNTAAEFDAIYKALANEAHSSGIPKTARVRLQELVNQKLVPIADSCIAYRIAARTKAPTMQLTSSNPVEGANAALLKIGVRAMPARAGAAAVTAWAERQFLDLQKIIKARETDPAVRAASGVLYGDFAGRFARAVNSAPTSSLRVAQIAHNKSSAMVADGPGGTKFFVSFEYRSCACGLPQVAGFPCVHMACAAAAIANTPLKDYRVPESLVATGLKFSDVQAGILAYTPSQTSINVDNLRLNTFLRRPERPAAAAARASKRKQSTGEQDPKKKTKCGQCGSLGHNKRTCPSKNASTSASASAASTSNSATSTSTMPVDHE